MVAMTTSAQLTSTATAVAPHLYWLTSRAAGIAALILSSLSVCIGLSMGGRLLRGRTLDLRVVHEALSLATLVALAVHGLALLGDSYIKMSFTDVAVPFASSYKTLWTSAGIVAFWALAALGVSYYARRRIGAARWRTLHRFTALAWILGIVHSLGEGTDAGQTWFLVMTAIVVVPALGLLATRWLTAPGRQQPAARRERRSQPALRDVPAPSQAAARRSGAPRTEPT
jgi:methionine sulfoxide reductase heme-binding subunit